MNDVIIKADNLYFSYDDEKSHSFSASLRRSGKKDCLYGATEIHLFQLQRNPIPSPAG